MRYIRAIALFALLFACATPAASPVVTVAPAHHRLGSVLSSYPLTVVENEDFGPLTFTYYTDAANTIPFNFTGYSASMMIRDSILTSPALTITPTLGGALGTLSIAFTHVQTSALVTGLPRLTGIYDIILTAPSGNISHFIPQSTINVTRSVTR